MNILWICTDQQRFDSLGCYGNPVVDTPNIDRLAREGVLFSRCYAQSPVCSPSRAAFLTGRYPQVCGMYENGASIDPREVLVTQILAEQGYTCGLAGKLHISACHPSVCSSVEPRVRDGYSTFAWSHHHDGDWPLNDYHLWLAERGAAYKRTRVSGDVHHGMPEALHHSAYCTDRALSFLRAHEGSATPWLFSLNYFDPHHPFDPPKELLEKYIARFDRIAPPNYVPGELENKPLYQRIDHEGAYGGNVNIVHGEMKEEDHRLHTAAYYAMVELIDTQVGRLMEGLRETGQADNTLVIFTSDHGEMLGDHGLYLKGPYFYEGAVRVPLILHAPGHVQKGLRAQALVELVDLPQTILEAAGVPAPPTMMGKSLWGIATGQVPGGHHKEEVLCEYYNAMPWHDDPPPRCAMIFDGRFKLTTSYTTGEGELYDLQADPTETHNRWADASLMAEKMRLLLRLGERLLDMRDPAYTRCAPW